MYSSNSSSHSKRLNYQDAYSNNNNHPATSSTSSATSQYCQNCKNYNLGSVSFSLCNECEGSNSLQTEEFLNNEPDKIKLMDLAAKVVAIHYPFQSIEERYERIPEPVQRRIIYWSFPQDEKDIIMYSSLNSDEQKVSFNKGQNIYQDDLVHNVLQVGFHLSGSINYKPTGYYQSSDSDRKYRVSITFDRCKITSVTCSCDTKDIFWCPHVVALALYRIRNPNNVRLRVPISETLLQLDKCQLQKLVQFLISEHHTEVLPTAQSLADKMLNRNSILNAIQGAPDPTAGAAIEQENCWHLDEQQITKQVTNILASDSYHQINKHINALFAKVKEMLKAKDSNASRMLRLITEQFLNDRRLTISWRTQGGLPDKYAKLLFDQLAEIWVYIALNPNATTNERKKTSDLLLSWTQNPNCPLDDENHRLNSSNISKHKSTNGHSSDNEENANSEDELMLDNDEQVDELIDDNNNNFNNHRRRKSSQGSKIKRKKKRFSPFTIFHRALEASFLKWDDPHLKFIIDGCSDQEMYDSKCRSSNFDASSSSSNKLFDARGHPLWNEPIPTACARVEALRCNGDGPAALRLAVAIVRSMKQKQQEVIEMLKKQNGKSVNYCNSEGWIGNPLDSISSLFDTLAEASLTSDSKPLESCYGMFLNEFNAHIMPNLPSSLPLEVVIPSLFAEYHESIYSNNNSTTHQRNSSQRPKPKYYPRPVDKSHNRSETYISLALEAALIGLGQQRIMPNGEYQQEKSIKQEERLIAKLSDIDIEYDNKLKSVLKEQVVLLLESGPYSGLGLGIHPESVPMHLFARYLFITLLPLDPDLAYTVGLRAMRLPILEGFNNYFEDLNNNNSLANNNHHSNRSSGSHNHHNHHHHLSNLYYQNLNLNNHYLYPFLSNNHQHLHHPYNRSHHHSRSNNNHANLSAHSSNNNWQRWHILQTIENNQCCLAITMISAARNNLDRLKSVQKAAQKHIHTFVLLFRLARDIFSIAIPSDANSTNCNNLNTNTGATLNSLHNLNHQPNHQQLPYNLNYNLNNLNSNRTANPSYSTALGFSAISFGFGAAFPTLTPNHHNLNIAQRFKNNTTSYLLEVAYELGLQVVKMTLITGVHENKRKEIVKWIVNCAIEIGHPALYYLLHNWINLFTPIEAVSSVANAISMGANKISLTLENHESLNYEMRRLAVDCTKKDPQNCALHALNLCDNDPMFEKCYYIVIEAGMKGKMQFGHLIAVAKYIESKALADTNANVNEIYLGWAYKLCQLAIKAISIGYGQENTQNVGDIYWACSLAHKLGRNELNKLVPILIDRIHNAQILSEILRKFTSSPAYSVPPLQNASNQQQHQQNSANQLCQYSYFGSNSVSLANAHQYSNGHVNKRYQCSMNSNSKTLGLDRDPLKALLDAALHAYVETVQSKLSSISPRHYSDFVDFLTKAQETFELASDGKSKFISLLETIKTNYKGKKKLVTGIRQKFNF